jgi:hypothetical protein
MKKKTIVRGAAAIGALVFLVCAVVLLVIDSRREALRRAQGERRLAHVERLRHEYQAFLDETAARVGGPPGDPRVIGDLQARHLRELPARSLYVWASRGDGQFVFGVPREAFLRLNGAFDRFQPVIGRDNHYATRDHFLRALLHETRPLTLEEDAGEDRRRGRSDEKEWWRFHRSPGRFSEWDRGFPSGPIEVFLSAPIPDAKGATVGDLNLKLVDERGPADPAAGWNDTLRELGKALTVPLVLSVIWLWFLLPSWVYVDARERGMPRPVLWAFLTLIGSAFALLVYLLSRPTPPADPRCPKCAKTLNEVKAGCPYCGADLSSAFCAQCQYPLAADWAFCPACRGAIGKPALA